MKSVLLSFFILFSFQFSYANTNLALNASTYAPTYQNSSKTPSHAVDGDSTTFWSSGAPTPVWWSVDLGKIYKIDSLKLFLRDESDPLCYGNPCYDFNIWGSSDSSSWDLVGFESSTINPFYWFYLNKSTYRYFKVEFTASADWSSWVNIVEFEVYGGDNITLNVPADYPTIQAGIDASVNGDTVLVEKGEYVGDGNHNIDFHGKAIYLKSIQGADSTIINCEGSSSFSSRGFYIHTGEDTTTIIDGFTITNGYANDRGGAVFCNGGAVKILDCIIDMNTASATGGGIYTYSSIVVRNTVFSNNNASTTGGGFTDRFASSIVEYCLFFDNHALNAGGGLHSSSSSTMVKHCTFSNNKADLLGGGMSLNNAATPTVINSIFSFNEGGGIQCEGLTIPSISCSNIYGNIGGDWDGCISDQLHFKGNFSDDPEFCNLLNNNFTLKDSSPCVPLNNSCNTYIGAFEIGCIPTGIKDFDDDILPVDYFLNQNYPNPFNPSTTIEFSLPQKAYVQLRVFNIMGQLVSSLIDKELSAGEYSIDWDGSKFASGIYMYKLKTDDFSESKEMLLLK